MALVTPNPYLDLRTGIGQVTSTFRWDLLDRDFNVIGNIHPNPGVSISLSTSATIMRTIRGFTLTESEASQINIFSDRVRPVMVLQDGTSWPMGVFYFTSDEHQVGSVITPLASTLMDQAFALNNALPFSFGIPEAGSVQDGMEQLIEAMGVTRFNIDGTNAKILGGPVNWPPDSVGLKILSDLASRAGFFPPYFDNNGTLILRAANPLEFNDGHVYSSRPGLSGQGRIVLNTLKNSTNLLTAPNAYKVISSGAVAGDISAVAYIDSALPHSRENRGFTIMNVTRLQGLGSMADCLATAKSLARQDSQQFATAEFTSVIDPRHDTFDTINLDGNLYREIGWTAQLQPGGTHTHTLVKKVLSDE